MPIERVDVLGIPVDLVTTPQVLREVRRAVVHQRRLHIVTVNAEFVVHARQNLAFRRVLEDADLATADSAGILWALRRQGYYLHYRVGGSDLVWSMSLQAAEFGHRIFFLGGGPGVAEAAAGQLVDTFPELQIAGTHAGRPNIGDEAAIVHLIRRSKADLLFVAFGAPEQDQWLARNQSRTGAPVALGVGGSLDYIAGRTRRAPVWMRQNQLDWLWRLTQQPWRWRRMLALPRFAWLVWRDTKGRTTKRKYR